MHKHDNHAFVNQLLVYTLVMICFSGSIGLGTVWMRHQISATANSAKVLDSRYNEIERQINQMRAAVEREQDPAILQLRNDQWNLGLAQPAPQQINYLNGDPVMLLAAKHNRDLFNNDGPPATVTFQLASLRR
jgi:hypothetical protein